jgi:hypothetical protein
VNLGFHPDLPMTAIVIVSIVNICLMVIAAFYRGHVATESGDAGWRVKLGLAAVCFGLCSQVLYCLMLAALIRGWVPFYSGNSFNHLEGTLSNAGFLLSTATFFSALLARGLRRYSLLWVAVTSGYLWELSGLGAALGSLFSR